MPAPAVIDDYARYRPQTVCDPTVKPGAAALLGAVLSTYRIGHSSGITRACSVGSTSEHKEGRAFDWAVNVNNPAEKAAGDAFVTWLTEPGPDGKVGWNARRLGVMYVIWNRQIWNNTSSGASWRAYNGVSPHTDHVHVSLSWAGAYQRTSWWTGVALPSYADSQQYVTSVYRDLLGRVPDPEGLRAWTDAVADGTNRSAVANAITSSTEYRSRLIEGVYADLLSRQSDPVGLAVWLDQFRRGLTTQGLEASFLAAQEYYVNAGSTDAGWVAALYQDVLGRGPGAAETQYWVSRLATGTSRTDVALGFTLSTERLITVVDSHYQHLLGRPIDPSGSLWWVASLQRGARTEQIIAGIIASEEYFVRAQR
jgi:hypothetical protein